MVGKKRNDRVLEDTYVVTWLSQVPKKSTKENYSAAIRSYVEFTGLSPSALILEEFEDRKKSKVNPTNPADIRTGIAVTRVRAFREWLVHDAPKKNSKREVVGKGVSAGAAGAKVSGVQSFYAHFDLPLVLKGANRIPRGRVINKRPRLSSDQIRTLVENLRLIRDKAICVFSFQTMCDGDTIRKLKFKDVAEALKPDAVPPVKVELLREKTDTEYFSFIGADAIHFLKLYLKDLESRGIALKPDDPLFISDWTTKGNVQMAKDAITKAMRAAAERADMLDPQASFNIFGLHTCRESASSLAMAAGVPETVIDFLLGHKPSSIDTYKELSPEKIREIYATKLEPLLSITPQPNGNGETKKRVEELETAKSELETKLGTVTENLRKVNEQLNAKPAVDEELMNHYHILEEKAAHLEARVQKLESLISRYFGSEFIAEVTTEAAEDSERIMPEDLNRAEKTPHKEELPPTKPKETKSIELDRLMAENQTLQGMLQKLVGA
jgi:hypothetical protein